MLPRAPALLPLLLGCVQDSQLVLIPADPMQPIALSMSSDVTFQWNSWGEQVGRCQVQVAFYETVEDDGRGEGGAGSRVERGDPPADGVSRGVCVYSDLAGGQAQGLLGVQGSRVAGERLRVEGPGGARELVLRADGRGGETYDLPGCDAASFPFGEALDAVIEDTGDLNYFQATTLHEIMAGGPDVVMRSPAPEDLDGDTLVHHHGDALTLRWDYDGPAPVVEGEEVPREVEVVLRGMVEGDSQPYEALSCRSGVDGELLLTADDLALLAPTDGETYIALQVDVRYLLPVRRFPWGTALDARSLITMGGRMELLAE